MNRRQEGIVENEHREEGGQQSRADPAVPSAEHPSTKEKRYRGRFQVECRPVRQKKGCSNREHSNSVLQKDRRSAPQQRVGTRHPGAPDKTNADCCSEMLAPAPLFERKRRARQAGWSSWTLTGIGLSICSANGTVNAEHCKILIDSTPFWAAL